MGYKIFNAQIHSPKTGLMAMVLVNIKLTFLLYNKILKRLEILSFILQTLQK